MNTRTSKNQRFLRWIVLLSLLMLLGIGGAWASAPTPDGRFYGDGDYMRYGAPYAVSAGGSELYVTLVDRALYVALVVNRRVNDNVFSSVAAYRESAGWNPPRTAQRLIDSEFAAFTLTLGEGATQETWTWQQGYAGVSSGAESNTNENWISGLGVSGGSPVGTSLPPGIVMASSMAWNMNNYAYRVNRSIPTGWNMGNPTPASGWTSPITNPSNPTVVINAAEGYPGPQGNPPVGSPPITYSPTYQWEWSMVYEWSVDLSSYTKVPLFVVSGLSHHSPAKNGGENDAFPYIPPEDRLPLMDFCDLPSAYGTLLANDGARHAVDPNGIRLGTKLDTEPDGQPSFLGTGDNLTGVNDEDGIVALTPLKPGSLVTVQITISNGDPNRTTGGYLSAFMDFNGDGAFTQINLVSAVVPEGADPLSPGPIGDMHLSKPGVYLISYNMPADAVGHRAARWRITNLAGQGGNSPTGLAYSGEVEGFLLDDPLLVSLDSFAAGAPSFGEAVAIRWSTAAEWDNVGFMVYRALRASNGLYVKGDPISPDIIPAAGNEISGADYEIMDPLPLYEGEERFYYLEDIDIMGVATLHGPVRALVPFVRGTASSMADWHLLGD